MGQKLSFLLLCGLLSIGLCVAQASDYERSIIAFQDSMNNYEKNPETTQILEEEFADFHSLEFFDIDQKYCVKANFQKLDSTRTFRLTYSNDPDVPEFTTFGVLDFDIDGFHFHLFVYQNSAWKDLPHYNHILFLPFKDWTNGNESYGGGRFLDIRFYDDEDFVIIDFNKSYNPPCAYNYYMACPLIPDSNHLECEIPVGIKTY